MEDINSKFACYTVAIAYGIATNIKKLLYTDEEIINGISNIASIRYDRQITS